MSIILKAGIITSLTLVSINTIRTEFILRNELARIVHKEVTTIKPVVNNITNHITNITVVPNTTTDTKKSITLEEYRAKISFRESSNRPYIVNQLGYLGLFQLGLLAFQDIEAEKRNARSPKAKAKAHKEAKIKYNKIKKDFIANGSNSKLWPVAEQIKDMNILIKINIRYLTGNRDYIEEYNWTNPHGVLITVPGLLAASHLCGHSAVKKYLSTGIVSKDGNGVPITSYLKMFENNVLRS
jgi:hypothetical protein